MRNTFLLFSTITALTIACTPTNKPVDTDDIVNNNPDNNNNGPKGDFKFVDTTFDFGNIKDGDNVQHIFRFKNTGKGPLSISKVEASCGCTTPDWTKEVIPPGGEGKVTATFDSKGKGGPDNPLVEKSIEVYFDNAVRDYMVLTFTSHILSKESDNHEGH